jgi:cell division protein FtsZ
MMGIGTASGENRAVEAAELAISSPLLEETITGAKGVVFNVTGGSDLTLYEVNDAAEVIYNAVDPEANIIFGAVIDEKLQGEVVITVIATGFKHAEKEASADETAIRTKIRPEIMQQSQKETIELPAFLKNV